MRIAAVIALVLGSAWMNVPAQAQSAPAPGGRSSSVLRTANPILRSSLERIAKGSASWRNALADLEATGRYALLVTPDQVRVADRFDSPAADPFDATILAEVAPVAEEDLRVGVVLIVVNVALLEESHRRRGSVPLEFETDLDRILVHEIYGHALPYLTAGHLAGRCPDPLQGERAVDACAIRRENLVRGELGLGRRTDHGFDSLALSRRDRR